MQIARRRVMVSLFHVVAPLTGRARRRAHVSSDVVVSDDPNDGLTYGWCRVCNEPRHEHFDPGDADTDRPASLSVTCNNGHRG